VAESQDARSSKRNVGVDRCWRRFRVQWRFAEAFEIHIESRPPQQLLLRRRKAHGREQLGLMVDDKVGASVVVARDGPWPLVIVCP